MSGKRTDGQAEEPAIPNGSHGTPDMLCGFPKKDGTTCRNRAGLGTSHPGVGHCRKHLGSSPTHERAAQRELARRECERFAIPTESIDPGEALLGMLAFSWARWRFYEDELATIPTHPEDDEYVPGEDGEKGHWVRGEPGLYARTYHISGSPSGEFSRHELLKLSDEERDRIQKLSESAARLNLEVRRIRLAEQEGERVNQLIRGILSELGVLDRPEVPTVVRKHLALIAGSAT